MKNHVFQITQFILYKFKSKTRYSIHSPFVYDLINNVISNKISDPVFNKLNQRKSVLLQDNTPIDTIDFGSGAGNKAYTTRTVPLKKLVQLRSQHKTRLELLFRLVRHFKPRQVLEFGTAAGLSASYLKSGFPEASLITMEGCSGLAATAEEGFKKLNINNIEVVIGNFDVVLPATLKKITHLDFVFFDGNHRKDPTLSYFSQCKSLANEHSVFVFDDIHWSSGMQEAWNNIKSDPAVSLTIDLFWFGLVFFRKGIQKQDFIIRY